MTLLSSMLGLSRRRSARNAAAFARDRRDAERFDVNHDVTIGMPGTAPLPGTVINISVSGAAIRIAGWNSRARAAGLVRLNRGDELWIVGMLRIPMSCWVVSFDANVLRVHFARGGAQRHQLRELIGKLASI